MRTFKKWHTGVAIVVYIALVIRFIAFQQKVISIILVGVPAGVIVINLLVIAYREKLRCPNCKATMALKKTGKKEYRGRRFFGDWYEEWKCKLCGYKEWRIISEYVG